MVRAEGRVVYFLFLVLFSILLFIYTYIRRKDKRIWIIYLFISGFSYIFDYFILIIFNAYQYKPHLTNDIWLDSTLGSIISQGIAIPVVAAFISAFKLRIKWVILFSLLFMGIEELFLAVDIYEHNWWTTGYTGFLLIPAFLVAKYWYTIMITTSQTKVHLITMYLVITTITQSFIYFLVLLFNTHWYTIGWFSHPSRDHIAVNGIVLVLITCLITFVIIYWFNWYSVALLLLIEGAIYTLLIRLNIMHIPVYWNSSYYLMITLVLVLFYRWLYVKWFCEGRVK